MPLDDSRLTVIIAAYNAEQTIHDAVASAIESGAHRVIVVDDGSGDGTSTVAEAAGAEVHRQRNRGASIARSVGGSMVDTEYVTFLDADDQLLPAGVGASLAMLTSTPELVVAAGRVVGFVGDGDGHLLPQTYTDVRTSTLLVEGYGPWPPGAAVQRTRALRQAENVLPVALRPRFAEDYELLIRLSMVGEVGRHGEPSLRYEMAGGKSARSAAAALLCKEALRAHYGRALGVSVRLMSPMRRRAAANKRVARGLALAGRPSRAKMALAYIQGAISLLERRTRIE